MGEDMIADIFNVGDRVECIRDSPDDNDSISVGMQGVICTIVDNTSPHIGVRWDEEVTGVTIVGNRALMDTAGSLRQTILSALTTMTSLKLIQQNWTNSLKLSQRRSLHDGSGFHKSALFAGLSGR